jgi:hypothetical protein
MGILEKQKPREGERKGKGWRRKIEKRNSKPLKKGV